MPSLVGLFGETPTSSAYYSETIESFVGVEIARVVGELTMRSNFAVEETQRDAWATQTELLRTSLRGVPGTLFLEFVVPRIGSRIDAVVITGAAIVVIEFKVGANEFKRADESQVWDYALDLKNFHLGSYDAAIFPILVATKAPNRPSALTAPHADRVFSPMRTNAEGLRD